MAKNFYSPYLHIETSTFSEIKGVFTAVKITSDDPTDDVDLYITFPGGSTKAAQVSSGDVLVGPFSHVKCTSNPNSCTIIVYEQSKMKES
jgi:hypothetical protein